MANRLPAEYQPNSRRLRLPWNIGYAVVCKKSLLRHRSWGRYGWYLPNTRRWRKIVRQALAQPRIVYDLIVAPGAAGVGCVFEAPPSYMYTQYGVALAEPSGRFGESKPNRQDFPPRQGRLLGSLGNAAQDREQAIQVMRGLQEHTCTELWKEVVRTLNVNPTNDSEPPRD